jgi:flagellar hook-length control protein FliK
LGTTAQAANLFNAAGFAGHTHPATQMVAASLTRAGKDGNSEMTLRLDPPELGNVNIRLSFTKDKTVKAHIIAEKPETYMMLQRDGHTLERALQNAGLDARSDSISFELAQGGTDFNNNGEGGGERNFGGGSNSQNANGGEELIQSTMTWAVDSETGHVRYNIFA